MSMEEKIQPEDFDKELEQLMSGVGEKTGRKKKGKKKKKLLIAAAILVVAAFAGTKVLGSGKPQTPMVGTINPVKKDIQSYLVVSGPVSGTDSVDVVSNIHAEVLEIPVKEGDKVQKGQVIAILDDTDIKKEVAIAKNDYDLSISTCSEKDKEARNGYSKAVQDYQTAQANYDRTKILADSGGVPLVDLETAGNLLNDAKRQMDSFTLKDGEPVADDSFRLQSEKARFDFEKKQEELGDTRIKSPIDGTVVRVNTKVGRFADKMEDEQPLFIIENLDVLEMEIRVSEYSISEIEVGQEVVISADILSGESVNGQVISISPTGEEKGGGSTERVIPTTIRILENNTRLIAGITAKAEILLEEAKNTLVIPISSLLEKDDVTYVQSVKDGKIHWIPVDSGVESDIETEITAKDGETLDETVKLVAAPSEMYTEGMLVTAQ